MSLNDSDFAKVVEATKDAGLGELARLLEEQRDAIAELEGDAALDTRTVTKLLEVMGERDASQAKLAEALKLIDQHYNDLGDACGAFQSQHDVDIVERFLDVLQAFLARLAQVEQQEAQGAQAGDEHESFEAWHRSVVAGDPPHEKYHDGSYVDQHVNRYWTGWQARVALATQPAVRKVK